MNRRDTSRAGSGAECCGRYPRGHRLARPGWNSSLAFALVFASLCGAARAQSPLAAGSVCLGGEGSGDVNGNGFVDLSDIAALIGCLQAPNAQLASPVCKCFVVDPDFDVDLADAAAILRAYSGSGGCTIDGVHYASGERGAFPSNCAVCNPDVTTTSWTVMPAGVLCNAGSGDACDPDELCTGASYKCPPDIFAGNTKICRFGSGDSCDPDEFCPGVPDQPCPADVVTPAGTVCHAALGPCDMTETCPGTATLKCPPNAYQPFGVQCRAGTSDCDPAEVCSGQSFDCPPDTGPSNCNVGDPCTADGQCLSGSCYGGKCAAGNGGLGSPCDSAADCLLGYICDGGVCSGTFSSYCTTSDQCGNQLACDAESSGECRVGVGFSCGSDLDCETNASCIGGVCKLRNNELCSTSDECGSGACICPLLSCTEGPNITCSCIPQGVCKVPFGGVCNDRNDCADELRLDGRLAAGYELVAPGVCSCPTERYCDEQGGGGVCLTDPTNGRRYCNNGICLPPVCSGPGTCGYGPMALGAICETDPPGGTAVDPPQLGDSPNDALCASGYCFKHAGGDNGPCTPARVCSGSTIGGRGAGGYCNSDLDCPNGTCLNPCGPYSNPPDYFCCRGLNGVCARDQDCCGGFLQAAQGCGSNGRCRVLAIEGQPCVTTADCVHFGQSGTLECIQDQFGNKLCTHPGDTPGLTEGQTCDPTAPNGYCRVGLTCFNCEQSGLGYICADATAPCCNSGDYDAWCPPQLYQPDPSTNDFVALYGLCCNNRCVDPTATAHCGECDNDCGDEHGNACVVPDSGVCRWNGGSLACQWTDNTALCPDPNPDDEYATRCVPTDTDTYSCESYVPITSGQDWVNLCISAPIDGRECTGDAQCADCGVSCTCNTPSSVWLRLFGGTGSCVCP